MIFWLKFCIGEFEPKGPKLDPKYGFSNFMKNPQVFNIC